MAELSPILRYTQILQADGITSRAAKEFYNAHKDDPSFVRRADVLHKIREAKTVPAGSSKAAR